MSVSHGFERVTADVHGDDAQTSRSDADEQNGQIDLEPQGKVARLEGGESGSEGCQCQVEHGVSHRCVGNVGNVLLKDQETNETEIRPNINLLYTVCNCRSRCVVESGQV